MPIPFRAELRPFLEEFVDTHRGARLGRMFGLPALYVGRRLVACLLEEGVIVRLPPDVARREIRNGAKAYSPRARRTGSWVMYTPRTSVDARRLSPILEVAARHVAERQME